MTLASDNLQNEPSTNKPQFTLTRFNNILYRASHVPIVIAYITLIIITVRGIHDWDEWLVRGWQLKLLLAILLLVPVFIKIFNYYSWILRLVLSSALMLFISFGSIYGLTSLIRISETVISSLSWVFPLILILSIPAWWLISYHQYLGPGWNRNKEPYWDLGLKSRRLLTAVSSIMCILFLLAYVLNRHFNLPAELITILQLAAVMVGAFIVLIVLLIQRARSLLALGHWFVSLLFIISMFALCLNVELPNVSQPILNVLGPVGLFVMLLAYDTRIYLSRLRGQWRKGMAGIRHDRFRKTMSATLSPVNLINRMWQATGIRIKAASPLLLLSFTFITAFMGAVILDFFYTASDQRSAQAILQLGFYAGVTFTGLYLIWRFFRNRQKHIVFPFLTHSQELEPLAQSVTNEFTAELRRLGQLLRNRQVENTNAADNVALAMFVTSGQEDDGVGALAELEFSPNLKITPARFLNLLDRILARTKIHGTIQERSDKSIEIHVAISTMAGLTFTVNKVVTPESGEVAEQVIQAEMGNLAMELVFKMGIVSHLSSTYESFQLFIKGLEASREENWWLAIAHYRRAIQIEETNRGAFGLGHYHLGAALISQGDLETGQHHLQTAIQIGPPLAEAHYMLAFSLLYRSADRLQDEEISSRILGECENALQLRPFFPEAHFLLGLTHYRLGQLEEKTHTRLGRVIVSDGQLQSGQKLETETNKKKLIARVPRIYRWFTREQHYEVYKSAYQKAATNLRRAIAQYDYLLRNLARNQVSHELAQREHHRLMRDRMSATHRLADSLRSRRLYSEADSYYDDIIETYPTDMNTLVDRSKTYCQASNWQRAIDYIWERLMSLPVAQWDAGPNFFLGWAIAGAVSTSEPNPRLLRWLIGLPTENGAKMGYKSSKRAFDIAVEAMDYALLVRPRRILRWQQTNWLPFFIDAAIILQTPYTWSTFERSIYGNWSRFWRRILRQESDFHHTADDLFPAQATAKNSDPWLPRNQLVWLIWRGHSFNVYWDDITTLDEKVKRYLNDTTLESLTEKLRQGRSETVNLLKQIDESRELENFTHAWKRLNLAKKLLSVWKTEIRINVDRVICHKSVATDLYARMALDCYAEFALLTVRMLSDAHAFSEAKAVAKEALEKLQKWLGPEWHLKLRPLSATTRQQNDDSSQKEGEQLLLSRKVLAHQLAGLYAWLAQVTYYGNRDTANMTYLAYQNQGKPKPLQDDERSEIEGYLEQALTIQERQPLALFIKAKRLQDDIMLGHAADELHRLLDALGYYDPFLYSTLYIADWEQLRSAQANYEQGGRYLDYVGLTSGQKQFSSIVSKTHVHAALAQIYDATGKWRQSVLQMQAAIVWSPYNDLDSRHFMALARFLNRSEKLDEALAGTEEVKARLVRINCKNAVTLAEPRLFETLLRSRLGQQQRAVELLTSLENWPDFNTTLVEAYAFQIDNTFSNLSHDMVNRICHYIHTKCGTSATDENLWIELAGYARNHKKLLELLRIGLTSLTPIDRKQKPHLVLIISQLLDSITWDAFNLVIQRSKALNNSAYVYTKQKVRLDSALEKVDQSISLLEALWKKVEHTPDSITLTTWDLSRAFKLDTKGWILFRLRRLPESLKILNEACDLMPTDPDIHYHLARVYTEKLHLAWKLSPDLKRNGELPNDLQWALHHYHDAKQCDSEGLMVGKLTRLYERIKYYEESWRSTLFLSSKS